MFKYILIEQILNCDSLDYGKPRILGTFDSIATVNRFIQTSTDYELDDGTKPKFIMCRQICEFPSKYLRYRLELSSIPHNPYNKIGELADLFSDEPPIGFHIDSCANLSDHRRSGYSIHPYFEDGSLSLQLLGWAIVLKEDGTWFWEDTSGG